MYRDNRHRKRNKYKSSSSDRSLYDESSDSLSRIRSLCDESSDKSMYSSTIDAIRQVCDDFNIHSETNTSPTTIDAIRERCNDFYVSSRSRDSSSTSTIDAIREICDQQICKPCRPNYYHYEQNLPQNLPQNVYSNESPNYDYSHHSERYNGCGETFHSIITPVSNLTPQYSGITGTIEFRMRRKNRTVTMQWEPFSGVMAASGVAFLTAPQSISNTPPYPVTWPIMIRYKDVNRQGNITIDPHATNGNIRFYLNLDGTGTDINIGDSFYIYSSTVTWLVN